MGEGRVCLVTQARHFVGLPAARALRDTGARVFCHDAAFADPDALRRFQSENQGLEAVAAQEPEALVDAVVAAGGRLDAVIHNDAFPAIRAPIETADAADLRRTLEALTVWPFRLSGPAVAQMKGQGSGRLVFVTSAGPLQGLPNYSIYATARGATNALVRSLGKELARYNIQVNAVAPNYVESPTYFPPELLADEAARAKILSNIPLGRLGRPEEIGALIAFFASDACGFVTGHVVPAAGGWA